MVVGDLTLQFKDGVWSSIDSSGNKRTVTAPSLLPPEARADAAEFQRVQKENESLRGEVVGRRCARQPRHVSHDSLARRGPQVNLLKFKIELLIDMLTLANLDCDKLEDEALKAKNTS